MNLFYSDTFNIPLPPKHRFPGQKYRMLRETLVAEGIVREDMLVESPLAADDDILRAHDPDYVMAFETGTLSEKDIKRIGFPWSDFLVRRTRATTGGAIAAAHSAMEYGISGQLAGGTHHAHRDFGAGYCIYNDQVVAALSLLASGTVRRVAIVDLDVHQGDGTAAMLEDHRDVFVFSMHGDKNFPFRKQASDLDVPLADGMGDEDYLGLLEGCLTEVLAFHPDIVLYQAGVDGLVHDRLGRLELSYEGLRARDHLVFSRCLAEQVPVSVAIGGGYSDPISQSVEAYVNTWRVAKALYSF